MNTSSPSTPSALPPVTAATVQSLMRRQKLPAAGLVVSDHDAVGEAQHAVGPSGHGPAVRGDTRFYFGSFTKVLTAAMVCQLADESRLRLDDAVTRYLPQPLFGDLTIRQLLSHTAGLLDMYEPAASADALLARLGGLERIAPPGQVFSYSNAAYVLLGRVIEELSGRSWNENLVARLLQPLSIESTSSARTGRLAQGFALDARNEALLPGDLFPDVGDVMDAAGGRLNGTADDAARLARALASGRAPGRNGELRLLSADMVAQMLKPHATVPGVGMVAQGWGLGWSLFSADAPAGPVYGHIGAASALVLAQPRADRSCAVLTNFAGGATVGRNLAHELLGVPLRAQPTLPDDVPLPPRFAEFAGRYGSVLLTTEVVFSDGRLTMTHPITGAAVPLVHVSGPTFLLDVGELVTDVTFFAATPAQPAHLHVALRTLLKQPGA